MMFVSVTAIANTTTAVTISSSMTMETTAFAPIPIGQTANSAVQYKGVEYNKGNTEGNTSVQYKGNTEGNTSVQFSDDQARTLEISGTAEIVTATANLMNGNSNSAAAQGDNLSAYMTTSPANKGGNANANDLAGAFVNDTIILGMISAPASIANDIVAGGFTSINDTNLPVNTNAAVRTSTDIADLVVTGATVNSTSADKKNPIATTPMNTLAITMVHTAMITASSGLFQSTEA
jgi:hypothetical protein